MAKAYDKSVKANLGFLTVLTMRLNGVMCSDGFTSGGTTWADWKDCHFTEIVPMYVLGMPWCGVYHDGWERPEAGMNGTVAPITFLWVFAEPYVRLQFYRASPVAMWWRW